MFVINRHTKRDFKNVLLFFTHFKYALFFPFGTVAFIKDESRPRFEILKFNVPVEGHMENNGARFLHSIQVWSTLADQS